MTIFQLNVLFLERIETCENLSNELRLEFRSPYGTNLGDADEAHGSQSVEILNSDAFKQSF